MDSDTSREQQPKSGRSARSRPSRAEEFANRRLNRGEVPHPPLALPYRALASSCRRCGQLVTPTSIHRSQPRKVRHACGSARLNARRQERRLRDEEYRDRVREQNRRYLRGRQSRSLETATRRGYMWTGPEVDIAMRADLTAEQVARMLGRTTTGVRGLRRRVEDDPRKYAMWGDRPSGGGPLVTTHQYATGGPGLLSPNGRRCVLPQVDAEGGDETPGGPEQRSDTAA